VAKPIVKVYLGAGTSSADEVTSYVRSVYTNRGKSRELDVFTAGPFSFVFDNRTRAFDPLNTSSPFNGKIVLRRRVTVKVGSEFIFSGYIENWTFSYDVNGDSIATASGADGFMYQANQTLPAVVTTVQKSGARILAAIGQIYCGIPGDASASIAQGNFNMNDTSIADGTNLLEYLQLVARSENGAIFWGKNNQFTFKAVNGGSITTTTFTQDGTDIPYNAINVNYGSDYLYNRIKLTNTDADVAIDDVASSISSYGAIVYEDATLLTNTQTSLQSICNVLGTRYSEPEYRFESVVIELTGLTSGQQAEVLALELTDFVQVSFTPNLVGSNILKYCQIIGIDHSISTSNHTVTFKFSSADNGWLTLDNTVLGRLDFNLLG